MIEEQISSASTESELVKPETPSFDLESEIKFAKIVSTPTLYKWAQAYNAGRLFAVFSLHKETAEGQDYMLAPIGKEIIKTLEEEYFTLEEKNLATIKQAVLATYKKIPEEVKASFVIVSIINSVMYVFVLGEAKAILKRNEKTGVILDSKEPISDESPFVAASGYLENGDVIVLETDEFATLISSDTLYSALGKNDPQEIAETLSPFVHEKEGGAASAFILSFKQKPKEEEEAVGTIHHVGEESSVPLYKRLPKINLNFKLPTLPGSKKMLIAVALALVLALGAGIFFAISKQEEAKNKELFVTTVAQAQKKYEEGAALLGLNRQLAREDLEEAKEILEDADLKIEPNSQEEEQIKKLGQQINEALSQAEAKNLVQAKEASDVNSPILAYAKKRPADEFFTQNESTIFVLQNDALLSVDKNTQRVRSTFENDNDWKSADGIGRYLTNLYVLDKQSDQVVKMVPAGSSYGTSNYLREDVDLASASHIAVDTSVWILFANGDVNKFTRGSQDSFSISGLEEPLNNPTRIFTDTQTDDVYILDKGNARIVVIDKKGAYLAQYQADVLKSATELEVVEDKNIIYVLSGGKIWEIPIK